MSRAGVRQNHSFKASPASSTNTKSKSSSPCGAPSSSLRHAQTQRAPRRDGQIHCAARKTNVKVLAAGGGQASEAASQGAEHETTQSCLVEPLHGQARQQTAPRAQEPEAVRMFQRGSEQNSRRGERAYSICEKPQRGSKLLSSLTQHSNACHCHCHCHCHGHGHGHCLPVNNVKREGQSLGLRSNRPRLWTKLSLHGKPWVDATVTSS